MTPHRSQHEPIFPENGQVDIDVEVARAPAVSHEDFGVPGRGIGGDDGQIDRIFRSSGLMRDKWDRRLGDTTYGATTIQQAIAGCHETYRPIADGLCLHVNDTRTATPRATQEDDAPVSSALPDFLQQASALPAREELIPGLIAKRETSLIHGAPSVSLVGACSRTWMPQSMPRQPVTARRS